MAARFLMRTVQGAHMNRLTAGLAALLLSACATHVALPDLALAPPGKAPAFDEAVAAFAETDRAAMPPTCATLFVGSSSIRFWRTLKEDFPDRTVINRGFGGSTVWEVDHYFDRVVAPYKPKEIVFYAGENDINAGRTPEEAYADFVQFMRLKEQKLGATPVWFISAKPSKLRRDQIPEQAAFNDKVKALADARDDLAYIDIVRVMMKADGTPKDIFVEDDLHMTPEGYALWTPVVDAALDAGQSAKAPGC
jgi:lysophospholipase L1-like esterase